MSKVTFEEDELTVVALFHENTRKRYDRYFEGYLRGIRRSEKKIHWKTICWKRLPLQSVSYR